MDHQQIETELAPRLKQIGFVLMLFSLFAFVYSFLPAAEEVFKEESVLEEEMEAEVSAALIPLNLYIVSVSFGLVGSSCVLISWRRESAKNSSS